MGRIREMIMIDGRQCWTLFDTGARNSYVLSSVAELLSNLRGSPPDPHCNRGRSAGDNADRDSASGDRRPSHLHPCHGDRRNRAR